MGTSKLLSGNMVDVVNREVFPGELQISNGRIFSIRRTNKVYNQFILPGFVDAHVHVESSMLSPQEFGRAALKQGVLSALCDPHEIANVCGVAGIHYMVEAGRQSPFQFVFGAPSCVPASSFDSSGALITSSDMKHLFENGDCSFMGEMMNFPGFLAGDAEVITKLELAKKYGFPIDGHAPGLSGDLLKKYVNSGISTDHECTSLEEAIEKISSGMKVLIREGSAAKNLEALSSLFISHPESIMLCTDDCKAEEIVAGYIRAMVVRLLKKGYHLFDVLRAVSFNPVHHYHLDFGLLQQNDRADFIVVNNLIDLNIQEVYIEGEKWIDGISEFNPEIINNFRATKIRAKDIEVNRSTDGIRVIEVVNHEIYTQSFVYKIRDLNTWKKELLDNDILKLVVVNRYESNKLNTVYVRGFGLKIGAIASSVSHDCHHIIAVGVSDEDIVAAINSVIDIKGAIIYGNNGEFVSLPLPIAGLMSNKDALFVRNSQKNVEEAIKIAGCSLSDPLMNLSFLALLVIPELKANDIGLFDFNTFSYTDLFVHSK